MMMIIMMIMMMMMLTRTRSSTSPGCWLTSDSSGGQEVAHCYLDDKMIIYMIGKQTRGRIEPRKQKKHKRNYSTFREPVILNIYDMFWTNDYTANVGLGVNRQ